MERESLRRPFLWLEHIRTTMGHASKMFFSRRISDTSLYLDASATCPLNISMYLAFQAAEAVQKIRS
jgi:hypothetical protein